MNSSLFPVIKSTREAIGTEQISNKSLYFDKYSLANDYGKNDTDRPNKHKPPKNGKKDYRHYKEIKKDEYLEVLSSVKSNLIKESDLRKLYNIRKEYSEDSYIVCAKLKSNLAINLSTGIIDSTGVSLDNLTGLPTILGSAVKGVSRHSSYLSKDAYDELDLVIFGNESKSDDSSKGAVCFFPALSYCTEITTDVLTPLGIRNDGIVKATPNKFLAVKKGSIFVFAVGLRKYANILSFSKKDVLNRVKESLLNGFEMGYGAKTAAGYGYFEEDKELTKSLFNRLDNLLNKDLEELKKAKELMAKEESKAKMSPEELIKVELIETFEDSNKFAEIAKNISEKEEDFQKIFVMLFSQDEKDKRFRDKLKTWKKKKPNIYNPLKIAAEKFRVNL